MEKYLSSSLIRTGMLLSFLVGAFNLNAQQAEGAVLNYGKIYGLTLNADIRQVLQILDTSKPVSKADIEFKKLFEDRFKYTADKSGYLDRPDTTLNALNRIYQQYWRKYMLNNQGTYDKEVEANLLAFFSAENNKYHFTGKSISVKNLDALCNAYVGFKKMHTTGFGKTGNLFDLLVWKSQVDTTYVISLIGDTAHVNIHLMDDFISLGWEEYATLGKYYPGGWATPEALFCVRKGYDLSSENYMVSYLSHEGQHFVDYKQFPKLSSNDLEYRAKLIELYLGNTELYEIIKFFIDNAKYDKTNSHPYADYCVIRDMSRSVFHADFENDINKWKQVSKEDIHAAAKNIFILNTDNLKKMGKGVKEYIK